MKMWKQAESCGKNPSDRWKETEGTQDEDNKSRRTGFGK